MHGVTQKMLVGRELLDRGLQMYFAGAYFAAIHLAGAAEEILGGYLKRGGLTPAGESVRNSALEFLGYELPAAPREAVKEMHDYIHRAKNRTKHLDGVGDDEITFDPKKEAEDMIERALTNFYDLMARTRLTDTARMRRFGARQ